MQNMTPPADPLPSPQPASVSDAADERDWFDLSDIVRLYKRYLRLFMAIVALCTIVAIVVAFVVPQTYSSVARIRIDPQRKAVLDDSVVSQNFQTDQARVDTEVQLMRSLNIAEAVVRKLELWRDPEVQTKREEGQVGPPAGSDEQVREVARNVGKQFEVRRNGNSFIVDLVYTAPSSEKAAIIANAFAEAYVDASGQSQARQAREQARYLQRQMERLGRQVRESDSQIAAYRAQTGITQSGAGGTVTDQQIGPISSAYAEAQSAAAEANGRLAAAQSQVRAGSIFAVSDVLSSTVINGLRTQRAELLKSKAELDNRYGPNHPETVRVRGQLNAIDGLIRDEADRIVSRLQADAQAANARAATIGARLGALRGEQAGNTRAAVTADSLQRENDANRSIYEKLAEQAQQTGQQAQVLQPAGAIVQVAVPPREPTFPNRKLFALAGLLSGILLGSGTIFVIDFLHGGVRTPRDLRALGVPFIGSMPLLDRRQRRALRRANRPLSDAVVLRPMSAYAEAVRTVRATFADTVVPGRGHVVTFVSALPGEGKTQSAISLGHICAASGDRTILVDCDLRRPMVAKLLTEAPAGGLVELLDGKVGIDQTVHEVESGLHVLPIVEADFTPRDLLGQPHFRELIVDLRSRYDVVILDLPPVLAVASTRTVVKLCNYIFCVVKWDSTPRGAIKSAVRLLKGDGVPMVGALLNMVDTRKQASISEDDPAYYQSAYASYYQN